MGCQLWNFRKTLNLVRDTRTTSKTSKVNIKKQDIETFVSNCLAQDNSSFKNPDEVKESFVANMIANLPNFLAEQFAAWQHWTNPNTTIKQEKDTVRSDCKGKDSESEVEEDDNH